MKVHQIWLNDEDPPVRARAWMQSIKAIGTYTLWGMPDARLVLGDNTVDMVMDRYPAGGPKSVVRYKCLSDLLRYAIMRDFGGFYCDIDVERRLPERELPEFPADTMVFFCPRRDDLPCNGLLYSPGWANLYAVFWDRMLKTAIANVSTHARQKDVTVLSGPWHLRSHVAKFAASRRVFINWPAVSFRRAWGREAKAFRPGSSQLVINQHWKGFY